jgi:hypothetical protein
MVHPNYFIKKETIYKNAIIRVIMQLPRGTFREIQKNLKTGDLLIDLERGKFSGICNISCRDSISTLVLKSGKCILAEYNTFKGDAALEGLLQALANEDIDAALSTLNEAQIQLSLEFNKSERITKTGRTSPAPQKPASLPVSPVHRSMERKPDPAPVANHSPPHENWSNPAAQPDKMTPRHLAGPKNPSNGPPASIRAAPAPVPKKREIPETDAAQNSSENTFDTLDSMNLDQVTDKIRDDCKTMVKNLHLDHLMDRD